MVCVVDGTDAVALTGYMHTTSGTRRSTLAPVGVANRLPTLNSAFLYACSCRCSALGRAGQQLSDRHIQLARIL